MYACDGDHGLCIAYIYSIILNIVLYPRLQNSDYIYIRLYVGILYIRSYFLVKIYLYICKLWFCGIVYSYTSVIFSRVSNAHGPIFIVVKIGVKIETCAPTVSMITNLTFYPIICG